MLWGTMNNFEQHAQVGLSSSGFMIVLYTLQWLRSSMYCDSSWFCFCFCLEVSASIGSPVMHMMKWPTTYTWYFALPMQLLPAPQSHFSFHLGCGYAWKRRKEELYSLALALTLTLTLTLNHSSTSHIEGPVHYMPPIQMSLTMALNKSYSGPE